MSLSVLLPATIARLKAEVQGFRTLEGLEQLALVDTMPGARPACYVIPAGENFDETQNGPGLVAVVANVFVDIVIIVDGSATRGGAKGELIALTEQVTTALLGWSNSGFYRPMVPTSSRLLGLAGGRASWIMRFKTVYHLRKQG